MAKQKRTHRHFNDGLVSLTNNLANTRNAYTQNTIVNNRLSDEENNNIYKSGIGNKIVNIKNNTAYKEGFTFDSTADEKYFNKFLAKKIKEASLWMTVFGRGIFVIIEKDKKLSEPLSKDLNKNTLLFKVFDGSMVTANSTDRNLMSERYYKPTMYQVRGESIHHSRVIDFTYLPVREDDKPTYQYGGMSEFELINEQIINDGVIERAAPAVLEKSSTIFYKVKGFKQAIQNKKESDILSYFAALENLRSVYGAGVVDSEDAVESLTQALSGLSETDQITLRRLALVTGIPLAVLVGESVKGLGANDDNEMTTFFMMIQNFQTAYLIDNINDLMEKLGFGDVEFNQPEQQTPKEKADLQAVVLDNATKLFNLGEETEDYLNENGFKTKDTFDLFQDSDINEEEKVQLLKELRMFKQESWEEKYIDSQKNT